MYLSSSFSQRWANRITFNRTKMWWKKLQSTPKQNWLNVMSSMLLIWFFCYEFRSHSFEKCLFTTHMTAFHRQTKIIWWNTVAAFIPIRNTRGIAARHYILWSLGTRQIIQNSICLSFASVKFFKYHKLFLFLKIDYTQMG